MQIGSTAISVKNKVWRMQTIWVSLQFKMMKCFAAAMCRWFARARHKLDKIKMLLLECREENLELSFYSMLIYLFEPDSMHRIFSSYFK